MDFFNCQTLDHAQAIVRNSLAGITAGAETVTLADALGRIMAEDVTARENIPSFSRSTVDGYAVNSHDTFGASESNPVWLNVAGEVLMGHAAPCSLLPGQTVLIPTGGMLPEGADSVVMQEHTEADAAGRTVFIHRPVAPGENIIAKGEDIAQGDLLLRKGHPVTVAAIGALAACGFNKVKVFLPVKAAVISTGDELVDISQRPQGGQVRDINSYTLAAALKADGCIADCLGIVRDCYEDFLRTLQSAVDEYPLVLISGGSSVGTRDYTVKAINALGKPGVLFHGLAIKPGKPTIYGMINRAAVFGLPGHPVSALNVYEQMVRPAIELLAGCSMARSRACCKARLTKNIASAPGRDDFIRVRLFRRDGEVWAEPVLGKSGLISTLLQADGIVRIDAAKSGVYKDEVVEVEVT